MFRYLKYLNLSYNLIEYIENLDKLNIQELNLEGNCIISFKSAVPGQGIYILPHLRVIRLGYNKITTLEFFKVTIFVNCSLFIITIIWSENLGCI